MEKNLTLNGVSGRWALTLLFALGAVVVSTYLTVHYFETHFSTDIKTASLCNISSFFNCDAATNSPLSDLFNVPLSVLGLLFALMVLANLLFPSRDFEVTNTYVAIANAVGCVLLFVYSWAALGSICPLCFIYYLFSFAILFMYLKFGIPLEKRPRPSLRMLVIYALVYLAGGGVFAYSVTQQEAKREKQTAGVKESLIRQYFKIPKVSPSQYQSPHYIIRSGQSYQDAPLRMKIFSDFQCPYCAKLVPVLNELAERYRGKLNIQYYFFPLDQNCNKSMQRQLHPHACQAAYIASCSEDKFHRVHDRILENQDKIDGAWLNDLAAELGIKKCVQSPKTKEKIQKMLQVADQYNLSGTPSIFINEARIQRVLPADWFAIIFDEILKRQED